MAESTLYTIADTVDIIAGDTKALPFDVARVDNGTVDLTADGTKISFYLTLYDYPDINVLTLTLANADIVVSSSNPSYFDVVLNSTNTYDLCGLYQYQIEIITPIGLTYRPITGYINILPRNH